MDEESKTNKLNYYSTDPNSPKKSFLMNDGIGSFIALALLLILSSWISGESGLHNRSYFSHPFWLFGGLISLLLSSIGIYKTRKYFKKEKQKYLPVSFLWIIPILFIVVMSYFGYQDIQKHKARNTRLVVIGLDTDIQNDLYAKSQKDPSQPLCVTTIIQHYIIKSNSINDGWGRPIRCVYPGTKGKMIDIFSAGPDGVYGNADDIGNWQNLNSGW